MMISSKSFSPDRTGREHDAVVVDARLGVEDRDLIAVGRGFQQVLQHSPGRHAVADDDKLFGHCLQSSPFIRLPRRMAVRMTAVVRRHLADRDMHPQEADGDERRRAA